MPKRRKARSNRFPALASAACLWMSPARRRRCIEHVRRELPIRLSERRICRVLGQHRSTQRKVPRGADDEQAQTEDIIALAKQYGRYGYRRVTALLCHAGWTVNINGSSEYGVAKGSRCRSGDELNPLTNQSAQLVGADQPSFIYLQGRSLNPLSVKCFYRERYASALDENVELNLISNLINSFASLAVKTESSVSGTHSAATMTFFRRFSPFLVIVKILRRASEGSLDRLIAPRRSKLVTTRPVVERSSHSSRARVA